jgi:hypothetical protein
MTGTVVPIAIAPAKPNAAAVLAKVRMVPPFTFLNNAKPQLAVAEGNLKTRRFCARGTGIN